MLFKRYLVEPILGETKTETRRLWKRCLVKVGGTYKAKTNFRNSSTFATITITYIRKERLGNIDADSVRKEGCQSLDEFKQIWIDSYGSWQPDAQVFVIGFQLI
jgi:hypothetical protein